jgi:WS/DGAT/MGAT family acyltransferase
MGAERLSPLSSAFLRAEDVDHDASLAIGSITVFDGPTPDFEEFLAVIEGRLALLPRYRQRLRTVPFGLAAPTWVDDPHFDVRWHVRNTAVPSPGGDAELARLMSRVMTQRMDRERPLWEYWFVEGLAEGRWAFLSKLHHSLVDGVSGSDIYRLVLDTGPEPKPSVRDEWQPQAPEATSSVVRRAAWEAATSPAHAARLTASALATPGRLLRRTARSVSGLVAFAGVIRPTDRTSLVGPLGASRRFAWTTVRLEDVATVRHGLGGSVNDVALAAVAGGFRAMLLGRGEEPTAHLLRSLVPVSVRQPGEESIRDNRVSLMLPFLPVDVEDPVERLAVVRRRIEDLKGAGEVEAGQAVTTLAELGPFPPVAMGLGLAFHVPQRWVSTVTTNVPGPQQPLYALGRRVRRIVPYVPIADRVRVGIAMYSYCGELTFGVTGDYRTCPDLQVLADGIATSLAELVRAAQPAATP